MKIAFVFAGQGAQYIGMGKELYENFDICKDIFNRANEVLGFDLTELIFNGEKSELDITENTQPAILTTSIAALEVLKAEGINPDVVAGLSLGEYSALVASSALSFDNAVSLVRKRGKFMQEAVPVGIGGMAAIIGLSLDKLKEVLITASEKGKVEIANYNTPSQVVIGGEIEAVNFAVELCKEAGAKRAIPLKVSGPFHTSLLEEASIKLEKELENIEFSEFEIPVLCNVTADVITDKADLKELLVKQVKSSVRWSEIINKMIDMGVDTFIELGPSRTLTSFIREISREVKTYNVEDMKSLKKTLEGIGKL